MKHTLLVLAIVLSTTTCIAQSWQRLDLPTERINDIDARGEQLVVLSETDTRTAILRSSDRGSSFVLDSVFPRRWAEQHDAWTHFNSVHTSGTHIFLGGAYNTYFMGCIFQNVGLFLRSHFETLYWDTLPVSHNVSDGGQFFSFSADTIFQYEPAAYLCGDWGTGENVKISTDSGKTYKLHFGELFGRLFYEVNSNQEFAYMLADGEKHGFYITHDGGLNWHHSLEEHRIRSMESSGGYWLVKGHPYNVIDSQWYSTDGINWTYDPNFTFPPVAETRYSFSTDSLFVSLDGGTTTTLHSILPGRISKVDTTGQFIYAVVNDSSVYKYPGVIKSVESPIDLRFTLTPNPTNDRVLITYNERLKIDQIYLTNIRGEKLAADVEWQRGAAQVDIQHFSSGIYFINILSTEGVLRSEKIVKY